MARSPAELIAQAKALERRLQDQQKNLAARQRELDATLRRQVALTRQREERQGQLVERERKTRMMEAQRAASFPRWLWHTLGLIPLILLLIAFFGVSSTTAGLIGAALGIVQILSYLRDRAGEREGIQ
jgi:Flp pilus assembly protein TadB